MRQTVKYARNSARRYVKGLPHPYRTHYGLNITRSLPPNFTGEPLPIELWANRWGAYVA